MAIQFIGSNSNNSGNTIAIPTHQIGDLIVVFAYGGTSNNSNLREIYVK